MTKDELAEAVNILNNDPNLSNQEKATYTAELINKTAYDYNLTDEQRLNALQETWGQFGIDAAFKSPANSSDPRYGVRYGDSGYLNVDNNIAVSGGGLVDALESALEGADSSAASAADILSSSTEESGGGILMTQLQQLALKMSYLAVSLQILQYLLLILGFMIRTQILLVISHLIMTEIEWEMQQILLVSLM